MSPWKEMNDQQHILNNKPPSEINGKFYLTSFINKAV